MGVIHLDTMQLPTATHSDRRLEIFHCSSAVNGSCPIERHLKDITQTLKKKIAKI